MKTIGILSDTHGWLDPAVEQYFKDCDEIWHAGDIGHAEIIDRLADIAPVVRAVRGNADHGEVTRRCPELLTFETEGVRVLLTHIGGYPGRYAPGMKTLLKENKPDILVDGHSHILKVMPDPELDLLHINPGAAGRQGWQRVRTIVRLTLYSGAPKSLDVIHL